MTLGKGVKGTGACQELFDALDVDGDGFLSRQDLERAGAALEWSWREARLYAVLDYLAIEAPLDGSLFASVFVQIENDPLGPFGRVLALRSPPSVQSIAAHGQGLAPLALLIIDPQLAFTTGSWMRSIGNRAEAEVAPIRAAFAACSEVVERLQGRAHIMLTRCPFPPASYGWDAPLAALLAPDQPYFIKPGNSVLWPETNGFCPWLDALRAVGVTTLVMGGCTLNSCVRVSSIETRGYLGCDSGLELVVDLSLCGARASNYEPSDEYGGLSSVESAIAQMRAAGARVVDRMEWPE